MGCKSVKERELIVLSKKLLLRKYIGYVEYE